MTLEPGKTQNGLENDSDMPGKRPTATVSHNKDGSISFNYVATDSGTHEMNVVCNDKPADGTPFRCVVDNLGNQFITAWGDGLINAASGENAEFNVNGGGRDLEISMDGPAKTELLRKEIQGVTTCNYMPLSPGEYSITIKLKGKHIHGSPFSAKVSGEGRKRTQLSIPATSEVSLGGGEVDLANMVGMLKLPSGASEPCLLKKMPGGELGIASFTPKTAGKYSVEVNVEGKPAPGSPFKLDVSLDKVSCASKVKVSGATKNATAQQFNSVTLDVSKAGHGALALSIEGPHRCDIQAKELGGDQHEATFKPHEPGIYLLNVRFADDHVPGSPFMVSVGGKPSGRSRETVSKDIAAVAPTGAGSKCEFQLKIPGTDPLDMEAALAAPSGKTELCEVQDLEASLYHIKFVPTEEGVHTVSLKHKGLHIAGSPFQYTVGQPPNAGAHKVEVGGPGMERGEVDSFMDFNIYTREAGAGKLNVSVEGPSKAILDVVDRGQGYTTVSYKVTREGEYGIHVKFNDEHVPDSPCMVYIAPESKDAKLVTVSGLRDRGLPVGKPATFNVNLNGAKGDLKALVETPSGTEDDCFLQELDRELHALRFMPKENGVYRVNVRLNEAHIPGSPFPMLIGKMASSPELVLAKGDGLTKAECGKQAKFVVVTLNSGAGVLNVQIDGPSKVAIQCKEVEEGYKFAYTPMAPGGYLINVKYSNITIAGCPTKAMVTDASGNMPGPGKPSDIVESSNLVVETVEKKPGAAPKKRFHGDASKVKTKGNGLVKGFAGRNATFSLDVKDAGNAMLTVAMMSPTGNPVEELNCKLARGSNYNVVYKTKEKGEHTLVVRWGADDIPGSPFAIPIN